MTFSLPRALRRSTATPATEAAPDLETDPTPDDGRRSRRVVRVGALAAVAVVLATGSVAVARAHKTVTVDVDGEVVQVGTFAGSVEGLLEDRGVEIGSRDVVAPDPGAELVSGDEVVVRHAHALRVLADGAETTVWTTALTADEALEALAARGEDVRLIPSRSTGGTRPELDLRLRPEGPVEVVVDGRTERVADGSVGVAAVFAELGISLAAHDRVTIAPAATPGGPMTILVQRVVVREVPSTSEVPFTTVTEASAELYRGESRTVTAGVPGELRSVHRVVLVDGAEESRRLLGEAVTREPVAAVVHEGTRARPARASGGGAVVLDGGVWDALARCESGGNPGAISASGKYYGLFQFSLATWQAMGGSGLPSDAPASEQLQRAQALQARSGWGQWPACARSLGLL